MSGAYPEKFTHGEVIGLIMMANSPGATSIPHYALSLRNPGEYAMAMWSNDIIDTEIVDMIDDEDNEEEYDFIIDDIDELFK